MNLEKWAPPTGDPPGTTPVTAATQVSKPANSTPPADERK
jgi:hypothetical protein